MKHVKKSVLLWYSAQEIYELVTRVTDYPQFLPWCEKAEILSEKPDGMTARLTLAYAGLRHAFTTENTHVPGETVVVKLVDGPFSLLEGNWRFNTLSAGSSGPPACKVELDLRYAFSSGALSALVSPVFDRIANTLVDSFVRRAEQVYGPR
ncbi:type II toxin-antitoxin system RatA family toxin [Aquabacterium sp. A7-Y]|uniref:type II toxin-antitoxin system RatA family toxin n=1 Tax=Aquabacterium sp. A7-Y TaxID=1349605 RepID=UPI00223D67CA|nr:type II toxin-antitoxin system RatA family toxin [Aquabacterium sp. A7-Y]MCW7541218.1 type II toxin-antitoxin system RatA family toxin [Aquabacterium sp. A7-Y]